MLETVMNDARAFLSALRSAPGIEIASFVVYGSAARDEFVPGRSDINVMAVCERLPLEVLKASIPAVFEARAKGISPFFITRADLLASADVFPTKFLAIKNSHRLIDGEDLLPGLQIPAECLRLRCEQEIRNVSLRMQRHYVMSGGRNLSVPMVNMSTAFFETLRIMVSGGGAPVRDAEVLANAPAMFGIDGETVRRVRELRRASAIPSDAELEGLFSDFMSVLSAVTDKIDAMKF